jgi:hypothetical protein
MDGKQKISKCVICMPGQQHTDSTTTFATQAVIMTSFRLVNVLPVEDTAYDITSLSVLREFTFCHIT